MLFVMAKCGNCITIWSLAKLRKIQKSNNLTSQFDPSEKKRRKNNLWFLCCSLFWRLHCPHNMLFLLTSHGKVWSVNSAEKFNYFRHSSYLYIRFSDVLGRFWLARTRDGWESCRHKKAVGAAIVVLIWNITSVVARIWTRNYLH